MSRCLGIIDLGSNTVRLAVHAVDPEGGYRLLTTRRAALRLSRSGQRLGADDEARTLAVLERFRNVCGDFGAAEIVVVATAAVRQAENGGEFVERLRSETGLDIQILDGVAEAELGFLGAINTLDVHDGWLADVGGGSTEVTLFRDRACVRSVSLPLGVVNLTARGSGPPSAEHVRREIDERLAGEEGLGDHPGTVLVGIGGTFRALARLVRRRERRSPQPLHGLSIASEVPARLLDELQGLSPVQRAAVPGLPKHRADLIVAGLTVVSVLVERLGASRLVVGGYGLRDGLFYRWLRAGCEWPVFADVVEESVANAMRLYGIPPARASRVATLAEHLFDGLGPLHRLGPAERRAVQIAARLRDVGACVDAYHRDDHTYYLLRKLPLFGLDPPDRQLIAAAAAFEGYGSHRERWTRNGEAGGEEPSARLGWMVAMADVLADFVTCPADLPRVTLGSGLATIELVSEASAAAMALATDGLVEDFRRLFDRPLAFVGRER